MKATLAAVVVSTVLACTPVETVAQSVTVDVIVTDAQSRPIPGLTAKDFELTDAGEPRAIEAVRLQSGDHRTLAIFLDEYNVSPGDNAARARAALTQFVNIHIREGDTVAIMGPLDRGSAITLTQDREVIVKAIAAFEGRRGDYVARSTFEENFISRDPKTADLTRAQIVTSALQALSARLGERGGGRKALVLVSEDFEPGALRAVVQAANHHRVAIYPIDPDPNAAPSQPALQMLAEQTGGIASTSRQDLTPALDQAVADLDGYYLLSYEPARHEDGMFHPVQVRVKRPATETRARAGYWAAAPAVSRSAPPPGVPMLPFRPSHSSPYIRQWIGMSRGSNGLTSVTVAWEAGVAPPGNQRVAAIALKAIGPGGQVFFQRRIGPGAPSLATFDAPPGHVALEMAIESASGTVLDTDYRALSVPNLLVTRLTLATPQVLRTRTARSFAEISGDPRAAPVASRTFSRTERLLVRAPVYGPQGSATTVTATLLNRRGLPMRLLRQVPADLPDGVVQFDLPLSSLAPDEYRVELVAANARGPKDEAREVVVFRLTN